MTEQASAQTIGILNPRAVGEVFDLTRHTPAPELAFFLQQYWIITWDLRERPPHIQETLPYPCVNVAIERGYSGIFGVSRGKFARQLEQKGQVFGAKFRPGAFYPFLGRPVAQISDRVLPLTAVFGPEVTALEVAMLAEREREAMVALFEAFLRPRLPPEDPAIELVNQVIERIIADRGLIRVEDVAECAGLSNRHLQRLFSQYVGVSPKWVIRRARLHEAAEALAAGEADLASLALDLGYFDQPHFVRDFKAVIGVPPAEYARRSSGRP
jgi:AraC-like DNA-binding protein